MKAAGLVLFACLLAGSSCQKPKSLQYVDVANIDVGAKNLKTPVVSADVRFYNPNPYKLKLRRAEMDVMVNDKFVGKSVLDSTIDIPRQDTFSIPVKLDVDLKTVLANSFGALLNGEVNLGIQGTANIGKAGIYKNFPFSYKGTQKIDLFR